MYLEWNERQFFQSNLPFQRKPNKTALVEMDIIINIILYRVIWDTLCVRIHKAFA